MIEGFEKQHHEPHGRYAQEMVIARNIVKPSFSGKRSLKLLIQQIGSSNCVFREVKAQAVHNKCVDIPEEKEQQGQLQIIPPGAAHERVFMKSIYKEYHGCGKEVMRHLMHLYALGRSVNMNCNCITCGGSQDKAYDSCDTEQSTWIHIGHDYLLI